MNVDYEYEYKQLVKLIQRTESVTRLNAKQSTNVHSNTYYLAQASVCKMILELSGIKDENTNAQT